MLRDILFCPNKFNCAIKNTINCVLNDAYLKQKLIAVHNPTESKAKWASEDNGELAFCQNAHADKCTNNCNTPNQL